MIRPVLLFSLLGEFVSVSKAQPVEIEPATGFKLEKILDYQDIHASTWDEHGVLWLLSGAGHRLGAIRTLSTDLGKSGRFDKVAIRSEGQL